MNPPSDLSLFYPGLFLQGKNSALYIFYVQIQDPWIFFNFNKNKDLNLKQAYQESVEQLRTNYENQEAQSIVRIVFEDLGIRKEDIFARPGQDFPDSKYQKLCNIIDELKLEVPVQYVLGYTWFLDRKFLVNPKCLIPRPETEELVLKALNEQQNYHKIIDIGTGSGCIAISLKLELPAAEVWALDKYPEALQTAKENASLNNASLNFIREDILSEIGESFPGDFDLIVSNPPYVRMSEKKVMRKNVLDYEPHQALFVKDSDPLVFYRAIRNFSDRKLKSDGKIFAEINESLGEATAEVFNTEHYRKPQIIKDNHGKDRFIKVIKK
jgi:release factor glutamine methyltransferase